MNRLAFLIGALYIVSFNSYSQTNDLLSTEIIGLGGFNFSNNVSTEAMGGLSTIYQSPFESELNFNNPAANSNLSFTAFDINGLYNYSSQQLNGNNNSTSNFNFNRISIGFPISKKINFGLGYKQFTNANKELQFNSSIFSNNLSFNANDIYRVTNENSITGGLKKLQSVISYKYSKNFSLGLSIDYTSGNIVNVSNELIDGKIDDPSDIRVVDTKNYNVKRIIRTESSDGINIKSLVFTLGALQKIQLEKNKSVLIGATFGSGINTNVTKSNTATVSTDFYIHETTTDKPNIFRIQSLQFPLETDLVNSNVRTIIQTKEKIKPMNRFSIGTAYEAKEKFMIGLDFQFEGTGIFNKLYKTSTLDLIYQDRYRISAGGWWIPNKNSNKNYFERVIYRGGLYHEQTPIQLNGKILKNIGLSIGSGLPIGKNTQSRINLGLEYVNRGSEINLNSNLNSVIFNFGINFNGTWFLKRFID